MLATHSKGVTRVWRLSESVPSIPLVHVIGLGTTKMGSICQQYAWSQDGSQILTRWNATISVLQPAVGAPVPYQSAALSLTCLSSTTVMRAPLAFRRNGHQMAAPDGQKMVGIMHIDR